MITLTVYSILWWFKVFKIFFIWQLLPTHFFVSLWQILQWYCSADKMGIMRKHLPTLANLMKLWGERRRKAMWVFKTTLCLAHPSEQSVFVLNNLVHNSRKKTQPTNPNHKTNFLERYCSGHLVRKWHLLYGISQRISWGRDPFYFYKYIFLSQWDDILYC